MTSTSDCTPDLKIVTASLYFWRFTSFIFFFFILNLSFSNSAVPSAQWTLIVLNRATTA